MERFPFVKEMCCFIIECIKISWKQDILIPILIFALFISVFVDIILKIKF